MKYVCFILVLLILISVAFMPVLAANEEPAPEPEEPSEAGELQYEQLYAELAQLRANTDYIFLGVIALCGVILGCCVGVTLIRLWGA